MTASGPGESGEERERVAYRELKTAILSGAYPPGARLVERDVAAHLGVSRSPVRGAFHLLEAEGLLERVPRRGVTVRILSLEDALHLLELREALEGMAARLAAMRRTRPGLERMREIVDQLAALHHVRGTSTLSLTSELHRLIFESSGNPQLESMAARASAQGTILSYRVVAAGGALRDTLPEHQRIVDCIARQDADGAEAGARAHMRSTRDYMLRVFCMDGEPSTG